METRTQAQDAFGALVAEVELEMETLAQIIAAHTAGMRDDPKNWGRVGAMGFILGVLQELTDTLLGDEQKRTSH